MARAQLELVLQYLSLPLQKESEVALSDGQLLERFRDERDENAFGAIVRRHAALVMNVARRVLHNPQDSEDVFQATFLILATRAGSIRRRRALAGWLYQVAHRLALKAKTQRARREIEERRVAAVVPRATPETVLAQNELRTVLCQELSRLPERYRLPLVLHYLEGKSKDETARQLGWSEGTVSGRLARARKLLHSRLLRRGFAVSVAGLSALLAESAGAVAVSPILLTATIRAAVAFGKGAAAGNIASVSATRLAQGMMRHMLVCKLFGAFTVILVAGVLGAGALTYQVLAGKLAADGAVSDLSENWEEKRPSSTPEEFAGARLAAPQSEGNAAPVHLSASGKVINHKGQPIAKAMVYLREMALMRDYTQGLEKDYTDILGRTPTDDNGRFDFRDVVAEPIKLSPFNSYRHPWNIVVISSGYGVSWHSFRSNQARDLTLTLRPEARIRGQLLDSMGEPAAGVRVQLATIDEQLDPELHNRVMPSDQLELWRSNLPVTAATDSSGRFVLAGLPPEMHIGMFIMDPRYAPRWLDGATIDNTEIERINRTVSEDDEYELLVNHKLLVNGFAVRLQPARSLHGHVIYGDTGKPVVGARVNLGIYHRLTNDQGSYSLQVPGPDHVRTHQLYIEPPEGADYLACTTEVTAAGTAQVEKNFSLERGAVVLGQLREKETNQPLPVAYVNITYQGQKGIGGRARTKTDGSFRIVVPPGKGKLFTYDSVPGCVPTSPDLEGRDPQLAPPAIEIKPGETLTGKNIYFNRGMVVEGRVLDPAGKPVAGADFRGAAEQPPSCPDGSFRLTGLERRWENHYLVLHAQRGLGAMIKIEPSKDATPVFLAFTLQPTKSLTAWVVDESKKPVANALVTLRANIPFHEHAGVVGYPHLSAHGPLATDAAGKFTLPNLVVGTSYSLEISARGYATRDAHFHVDPDVDPVLSDLMLWANKLALHGVVLDQAGKPVEGLQVKLIPNNEALATPGHRWLETKKDGRFQFHHLAKGDYRLIATLWKKTGDDKNGRPIHKMEANTELRVEPSDKDIRVILHIP